MVEHLRYMLMLLVATLWAGSARSQQWDVGTWHGLKAGGELVKNLSLSIEPELRLNDNSTKIDKVFGQLGMGYDLPKGFALKAAYRLSVSPVTTGGNKLSHRYNIDLSYSKKFWRLKMKARARFQHRPSASEFNDRLKSGSSPVNVRLKFSLSYAKLKDLTPGLNFEVFFLTNDPIYSGASKFRYRVFLDIDLPKREEIGIFYMLQTDYSDRFPVFSSIIGVNYSYEWKRPKKKKKENHADKQ